MFENIVKFFKKFVKEKDTESKDTAKERLHLVLMQDRANVSADFLELMKQEIIDVIKKYIDVDENSIDVKLTNKTNSDGTTGAPILYANIPIVSIKDENKNKVVNENKEKQEANNKDVEEKVKEDSIKQAEKVVIQENKNEEKDNSQQSNNEEASNEKQGNGEEISDKQENKNEPNTNTQEIKKEDNNNEQENKVKTEE